MSVNLCPTFGVGWQGFDSNGVPLNAGFINTYAAGSSTPLATYTTVLGTVANSNPIVLNADGRPPQEIWLLSGNSYKFVLTDSLSNIIDTYDNITGINDVSASTLSEWIALGTPTFLSTTSFSLAGNQTSILKAGRRLQSTNTGGTIYSNVATAVFTTLTTVTVTNDSGVLDSGLSAVNYGLLGTIDPSMPPYVDAQPILQNISDVTKLAKFSLSSLTTGATRTYTLQDSNDTLVGRATTDTLTNKTISAASNTLNTVTLGTPTTASTTAVTFTGIPSTAKRIIINFFGISTNGTSPIIIRLGDSGGIETGGYLGATMSGGAATMATNNNTDGFYIFSTTAAGSVWHGTLILSLENSTNFTWCAIGNFANSAATQFGGVAGTKATSAVTDRVSITTTGGADTFDAGEFNIQYES